MEGTVNPTISWLITEKRFYFTYNRFCWYLVFLNTRVIQVSWKIIRVHFVHSQLSQCETCRKSRSFQKKSLVISQLFNSNWTNGLFIYYPGVENRVIWVYYRNPPPKICLNPFNSNIFYVFCGESYYLSVSESVD